MKKRQMWLVALLALLAAACTPTTSDNIVLHEGDRLAGSEWELTGYGRADNLTNPAAGAQITISFVDGQIGGSAGCNSYGGGYDLNGSRLTVGEIALTAMACVDEAVMAQEDAYIDLLVTPESFMMRLGREDGLDTLTLTSNAGVLTYRQLVPLTLDGAEWQLNGIATDSDAVVSTWVDEFITLTFGNGALVGSGELMGNTGCNSLAASYEVDNRNLSIGPVTITEMACDDARSQREAEFLAALAQVTGYRSSHNSLALVDANGQMVLSFRPVVDPEPAALYGRVWEVVAQWPADNEFAEVATPPLPVATPLTIQFVDDHIWGDSGCNIYAAPFFIVPAGGLLHINQLSQSGNACDEETAMAEALFFDVLLGVETFTVTDDILTLDGEGGGMRLAAMGYTDYMPRFVALADGRRCSRTAPNDILVVDGRSRTYDCQSGGLTAIIGDLRPTADGWQADVARLEGNEDSYTVVAITEMVVELPPR